jgi:hypothetical protein
MNDKDRIFDSNFNPYDILRQLGHNQDDLYNRLFSLQSSLLELEQKLVAHEQQNYKLVQVIEGLIKTVKELLDKD